MIMNQEQFPTYQLRYPVQTTPTTSGTGLGLAVVHGIVKKCDGKILVSSKVGHGSMFTIYLPVAEKSGKSESFEEVILATGRERILFVDDEPAIVEMNQQALEKLGYSVTTRTSGVEALKLFRAGSDAFDLVITDMTMPNMTGDKLIVALRDIRPDIKTILCTGYSKKVSDRTMAEIGIDELMYKPIVRAEMARIIRKVFDSHISPSEK